MITYTVLSTARRAVDAVSTKPNKTQLSDLKVLTAVWDVAGTVETNCLTKNFSNDHSTEKLPTNSSPAAGAHKASKALIFNAIFFVPRDRGTTYQGPLY